MWMKMKNRVIVVVKVMNGLWLVWTSPHANPQPTVLTGNIFRCALYVHDLYLLFLLLAVLNMLELLCGMFAVVVHGSKEGGGGAHAHNMLILRAKFGLLWV